ncbi:proline-rich protein 2-like isoform X3 [Mauremys reevesii]|uniref:proline-rich protein 2-like isoform X3 n=1 Tax=Mauremys reevesii TaxID=260615 RepID=UPI00193FBCFD|nr:proline-rich protein 2-like isoform X3 [Mauremys reevesii]
MASALMILFLGCWLAGQSGVSGDAGSIPTGGTNLTQPGMMPAPTRPGSAGPSNKSGSRKSPSTTPQTDAGSIPAGGTDLTQPGTTPAPTHPGSAKPDAGSIPTEGPGQIQPGVAPIPACPDSAGPDGSEPPMLALPNPTCPTIIGLSTAAALLLLLLLVAFVCFRKTRASQQSNEDLLSATEQLQQ